MIAVFISVALWVIRAQDTIQGNSPELSYGSTNISGNSPEWSYGGTNGPDKWCQIGYDDCCGLSQSPINIWDDRRRIHDRPKNSPIIIDFHYYDTPLTSMKIKNTGHTVELTFTTEERDVPQVTTPELYYLYSIQFHWASYGGSEHAIDGQRSQMEMQLIHYNSKYSSSEEAEEYSDGLVILAVFIQTGSHNDEYANLVNYLQNITYKDEVAQIPPFTISKLMPYNSYKLNYYVYSGSLTTPPCSEGVTWAVYWDEVKISDEQLNSFLSLYEKERGSPNNSKLKTNNRPLQELNKREIYVVEDFYL